jgi:hypothetical protein
VSKGLNDDSCLLSPLCTLKGGCVYLSLVASQGGGIHAEEEFGPCIRVHGLLSPSKRYQILSSLLKCQDLLGFDSLSLTCFEQVLLL